MGKGFRQLCQTDLTGVADSEYLTLYSVSACIEACAAYNEANGLYACRSLTYNANLTSSFSGEGGNCFLKAGAGTESPAGDVVASAQLEV